VSAKLKNGWIKTGSNKAGGRYARYFAKRHEPADAKERGPFGSRSFAIDKRINEKNEKNEKAL